MFGLGYGTGGLVGGMIYQRLGAHFLFLIAAFVMLCGWVACATAQLVIAARRGVANQGAGQQTTDLEMVDV